MRYNQRKIWAYLLVTYVALAGQNAYANGIQIIVNKMAVTFDRARAISNASNYVMQADAALKIINNQLSIVPSGALGDIVKLGADAKFLFVTPLVDGRYFIQALSDEDYSKALWHGLKIYTYFFDSVCFHALTGLENLLTIANAYQRIVTLSEKYREQSREMARKGKCAIL